MTIVVTGAYGFIGANIISELNSQGYRDIIAVDDLKDGTKFRNLSGLCISEFLSIEEFNSLIHSDDFGRRVDVVIHMGACSDTTEWDGAYMMKNNYRQSIDLLKFCEKHNCQFLYASSASVYGLGESGFHESPECENAINVYGYSKLLFDQFIRARLDKKGSQIVGFRFFNVFGPREDHKKTWLQQFFILPIN